MEPLKPQTDARIDPWDPDSATLAVLRIRETAVSVADDSHESVTYTRSDPPTRRAAQLKTSA
jgi:hypothetical protein